MNRDLIKICEEKIAKSISDTWDDIAKKNNYSSGEVLRCAWKNERRKKGTLPSKEDRISDEIESKLEEINSQMIELKKEKIKIQDQKTIFNRIIRESARHDNIKEEIIQAIKNSDLKEFKIHKTKEYFIDESKHEMVVCFSDFHYGLVVDNHWNKFNKNIFVKRFMEYIERVVEIGKMFNVKRIVVLNLGDIVSGNIHIGIRVSNSENIIKQTQDVSEYISFALNSLAENFEVIDYYSAIGNHGRVTANKHDAISGENFEDLINWYLRARLSNVENITIHDNVIDKDIIVADVKGHIIFGCHGDKNSMKTVVQDLSLMIGEIPKSCYMGHLHHYAEDTVQGVDVIMSGSMIGTDDYAKDIRKVGQACQTVCIYDEKGKVCSFNVVLS